MESAVNTSAGLPRERAILYPGSSALMTLLRREGMRSSVGG